MTDQAHTPNGWTVYTLKAYVDRRFEDADKAVVAALSAQKEAVVKAEIATEKRFEQVRQEADARMNALGSKIDELKESTDQALGRRDQAVASKSSNQWAVTTVMGVFMFAAIVTSGILGALHI